MADRGPEFLDLMKAQQLTPAEYLEISQVAGQRARQDIPSFGIAEREQELEATRRCAFCRLEGATRASMLMGASAIGAASRPMAAAAGHSPR